MVRVTDLKQWAYCPRVVYFHYVMPVEGVVSTKMEAGREAEEILSRLETKRSLRKYRLREGRRYFRRWLTSDALGLTGRLDLLIDSPRGLFPVDVKFTLGPPRLNHKLQLAGYALLVEEAYGRAVHQGFIYRLPDEAVFPVEIDRALRNRIYLALDSIRQMVELERMPEDRARETQCRECEFQNFCADVW